MASGNPPDVPDDVEGVTLSRSEVLALIQQAQADDPAEAPESTTMGELIDDHPMVAVKTHGLARGRVHVMVQYAEDRHAVTGFSVSPDVWRFLRLRESEMWK